MIVLDNILKQIIEIGEPVKFILLSVPGKGLVIITAKDKIGSPITHYHLIQEYCQRHGADFELLGCGNIKVNTDTGWVTVSEANMEDDALERAFYGLLEGEGFGNFGLFLS